jgi:HAD superfamily hydrolase (TIGR01490 family)
MNDKWAIFDFDGTLFAGNSFNEMILKIFIDSTNAQRLEIASNVVLRKCRMSSIRVFQERILFPFRGWSYDELTGWGENFFHEKLENRLLLEGKCCCQEYVRKGFRLLLATGAPEFFVRPIARFFGFSDFICTNLEFAKGKFTGNVLGDVCLNKVKANLVFAFFSSKGIPLSDLTAYSDNNSDLHLLEMVGHPVVINPDVRLRRYSRRKDWPIYRWTKRIK